MVAGLTWLLVYQLAGEVLVRALALPVPGPVVGMVLLFATLILRRGGPDALHTTAQALLSHLSLLFVPAGVGVMIYFGQIAGDWLSIVTALVASTILTLAVTALTMRWMLARETRRAADQGSD